MRNRVLQAILEEIEQERCEFSYSFAWGNWRNWRNWRNWHDWHNWRNG